MIGMAIIANDLGTLKVPPIGDMTPDIRRGQQSALGLVSVIMDGDLVWPKTGQHRR